MLSRHHCREGKGITRLFYRCLWGGAGKKIQKHPFEHSTRFMEDHCVGWLDADSLFVTMRMSVLKYYFHEYLLPHFPKDQDDADQSCFPKFSIFHCLKMRVPLFRNLPQLPQAIQRLMSGASEHRPDFSALMSVLVSSMDLCTASLFPNLIILHHWYVCLPVSKLSHQFQAPGIAEGKSYQYGARWTTDWAHQSSPCPLSADLLPHST